MRRGFIIVVLAGLALISQATAVRAGPAPNKGAAMGVTASADTSVNLPKAPVGNATPATQNARGRRLTPTSSTHT